MSDVRSPDYREKRDEAATPPPMDPTGPLTPVLEPNEARGATTKPGMWRVLTVSLVGVVIAMAIAWFLFFPTPDPLPPAEQTTPEAAQPAPPAEPTSVP
jgi:hypothetical protein